MLQTNNIHIAVCTEGEVTKTLAALKAKAKFVLATDGVDLEAEDLASGETVVCLYPDFPNHFGFFLPLAGITTVKKIRDNPVDIQATIRAEKRRPPSSGQQWHFMRGTLTHDEKKIRENEGADECSLL